MSDPRRSPIREELAKSNGPLGIQLAAIANKDGVPKLIGFAHVSRIAKGGRWLDGPPVTIHASNGPQARC
jgi:hypothetical protein